MKPTNLVRLALLSSLLAAIGCGPGGKSIQDTGSDTMGILAQSWAEAYHQVKPDVSVQVSNPGSGVGIAALEAGQVDIANASREIEPDEAKKAKANTGKDPKEITVALDGLAVYVHKDNPLDTISVEELADIFGEGGKIEKWSQLGVKVPGCEGDQITRITRQSSSGTWVYFREAVMGKGHEYKKGAIEATGSKEIITLVGHTPCAIGYSGMGYNDPAVKWLKVSKKKGDPGVPPSVAAVLDHTYPIARKLYMYTLGEPAGEVKAYIDWVLSPAGQKIVEEVGFVPVPKGAAPAAAPAPAPAATDAGKK